MTRRVPVAAALELTLRCPCRCQTCGSHAGGARKHELSHDEWLDVIATLADLGCGRMSLIGGEPLLYPRWPELVRAARARDVIVDMVSCGQGLDDAVAATMVEAGLGAVTISVDGLAETHDRQRSLPGCFAQAIRAIETIDRAGLKAGATSQVNRGNLHELEALAPILEAAGVLGWQWQLTMPMGRARQNDDLVLRPEDMPELLQMLRRIGQRQGLRPHITDNVGYGTVDDLQLRTIQGGFPRHWLGCRAGLEAIGITSDGRVKGCLALPDVCTEGNVRDESLRSIWMDPSRFAYNRQFTPNRLSQPCASCDDRGLCRGGCTAMAYAVHGRAGKSIHCFKLLVD